ncbi:MAG TPA: hypothetical protein VGU01_08200 [Sphingomicrobium sp.]|nr:hypothetical protein [Sphingomicrobium sp.]
MPSAEHSSAGDVAMQIGTDERRMHVRAYNYWVSLLEGRDFPSIEDLEPSELEDFSANSVLLDFTCGRDNPAICYVGAAIREECALDDDVRTISDVPSRSLLSRLTDHFMQIIANRAPVGFEAEFENPRGDAICYRGILMPFSSDGDAIDFIYGVINWKHVSLSLAKADPIAASLPVEIAAISEPEHDDEPLELTDIFEPVKTAQEQGTVFDGPDFRDQLKPTADPVPVSTSTDEAPDAAPIHFSWEDGPLADSEDVPIIELDAQAGLADRLWAARETAETVKAGEGRTRSALYKALSLAYDFAIAADQHPQDYAELLEDSGLKAQSRAPMTPIVKLVFGIDYDKARLTEFAASLSFAHRQQIPLGGFLDLVENQPGGLKALVAAERQARRPASNPDSKGEAARARLRSAPSISLADVPEGDEFAVVLTRRGPNGTHEAIAILEDEALVERVIRRSA